jgi:hypothetical protein
MDDNNSSERSNVKKTEPTEKTTKRPPKHETPPLPVASSPPQGLFERLYYLASVVGVIFTGGILLITFLYYKKNNTLTEKNTALSDRLVKASYAQVKELISNDSSNQIKDEFQKKRMKFLDLKLDTQVTTMRLLERDFFRQEREMERQTQTAINTFRFNLTSGIPLTRMSYLLLDTLDFSYLIKGVFINMGNRPTKVDTCLFIVFNEEFKFYREFKDSVSRQLDPRLPLIYPLLYIPKAILNNQNTLYYYKIVYFDNTSNLSIPSSEYFKGIFKKDNFSKQLLSPQDSTKVFDQYRRHLKSRRNYQNLNSNRDPFAGPPDTIDERQKSVTLTQSYKNLKVNPDPRIIDAKYTPNEQLSKSLSNLYISNLNEKFPYGVFIDNVLLFCIDGLKAGFSYPLSSCQNPVLTEGYHKLDIYYDYNPGYKFSGFIKIIQGKKTSITIY